MSISQCLAVTAAWHIFNLSSLGQNIVPAQPHPYLTVIVRKIQLFHPWVKWKAPTKMKLITETYTQTRNVKVIYPTQQMLAQDPTKGATVKNIQKQYAHSAKYYTGSTNVTIKHTHKMLTTDNLRT